MKKGFLVFLAIGFVTVSNLNAQQIDVSVNETGKICFIRSTGFQGSATAFKTFIDEQFVCKLNNKRYSIHEVLGRQTCLLRSIWR